jgi:predicted  nucleic acid-binding Zn-ribbon protein
MAASDNIVLEHLRHICGAVDVLRDDVREVKQRVGGLEREMAQVHVKVAELSERIDRLSTRIERVEIRLDLAEA